MHRPAYAAHERLIAPARPRSALWRLLAGLALVGVVVFGLNSALQSAAYALAPVWYMSELVPNAMTGSTPGSLLFLLSSFAALGIGAAAAARLLHRRPALSLLGPPARALRDFVRVLAAVAVLGAVLLLAPPWDYGEALRANTPPGLWLSLLPLALPAVLVQVASEELLFRGYLQQQLAARFRSPLVWMVLPSALFAAGHYLPAEAGGNAVAVALWSGVFGLLMADLTARAGNLGPAIAVHFANNVSAILLISLPDTLDGLSLYTVPFAMNDPDALLTWMPVEFGAMLVTWLAARVAIRR